MCERDFVEAARAMCARSMRIAVRHVSPNTPASVVVLATPHFAPVVLQEAALSFLGVGTGSPASGTRSIRLAREGHRGGQSGSKRFPPSSIRRADFSEFSGHRAWTR